ncbi:MAG: acetyltransferase [Cyclobacteriaceae bacterium]
MKNIAIYGAGGFGRETALLIQQINEQNPSWNIRGFFDDGLKKGSEVDELPILGGMEEAKNHNTPMVIAVADPATRKNIAAQLQDKAFPILAHPLAQLGSTKFNTIARGCIITAGVILTTHIVLEEFCIINLDTTVGHDVSVGAYSTIMPGCSISGNVKMGQGVLLGTGARMLQKVSIGDHATIGAGAVVTKPCPPGETWVGVPAMAMKKSK